MEKVLQYRNSALFIRVARKLCENPETSKLSNLVLLKQV